MINSIWNNPVEAKIFTSAPDRSLLFALLSTSGTTSRNDSSKVDQFIPI